MNGFFGVGPFELLVIAVLALIFIGPQRLPGVIQQVMSTIRELRSYAEEMRGELGEFADIREELLGVTQDLTQAANEMTRDVNQVAGEVAATTGEITTETQKAMDLRPTVNELMAPPPPRDTTSPLPAPTGVHTNGASHDDEDERPAFTDYRPGA